MRHKPKGMMAVCFCLALGCGSSEVAPVEDMRAQVSQRDSGASSSELDMGSELGFDATELVDLPGEMPPQSCESLRDTACFERAECVWDGQECKVPFSTAVLDSPTRLTRTFGHIARAGQESQELSTLLSIVQTGPLVQGSLSFASDGDDVTILVHGVVDENIGQMNLNFEVPACVLGEGGCDERVAGFQAQGFFDGSQWLFNRPNSFQDIEGASLFQNFRYQPNDGIKPSNVRELSLRGTLTTIFAGAPLDPQQECLLIAPATPGHSTMPSLSCRDGLGVELESVRMLSDTFAIKAEHVWFRIEADGQELTFIGVDDYDIGGVLVVDDGAYFSADATPIELIIVDPSHVVGAVVFEPTNMAF